MKNSKKFLALGCSVIVVVSSLSGCSMADSALENSSEEVAVIQNTLDEFESVSDLISHSDTAGKNETVYAILDADGKIEQTIVSEWLKNPDGSTTLSDRTDLSDITVVKGNAEYTKEGSDNQIVWTNDGSDIYYQGNSEKELPVDVRVSYELDDKNVTAGELKGASGHLKITFTYTNNVSKETRIHGEKRKIYQPFIMISGMLLDNSKAQNITIDNGSVINSGDDTVVFGIAMPGLKESLGLDDIKDEDGQLIDFDIPESVTVEADVTDFSLMMTLTLASNNALSQLGLDDIDSIDDLKADMDELNNGMTDIIDGATRLKDGTEELKDGTESLSDGTKTFSDGTAALSSGTHKISDGAKQVNEGAAALKNGLDSLNDSAPALALGVDSLTRGADQLSSGFDSITGNNDSLNAGAAQISEGLSALNSSLNSEKSKQQLEALVSGSTAFSQGLSQASEGLSEITAGYSYDSGNLANVITGLTEYVQELAKTEDSANVVYAGYIQTIVDTYKGLYDNVEAEQLKVGALPGVYGDIYSGIKTAADSVNMVSQAVGQLSVGAGQLREGVEAYTAGISQASAGVKTLDEGLNSLNTQIPVLVNGIGQLSDGADSLAAGTGELAIGASSLVNGADEVDNGSSALKNGVEKLLDGVKELVDGTGELKDGVIEFNDEGIQKLADIVKNDLETYYDRLKAVQDYAKEYTSYAGCDDSVECSLKFIYKTGSIE